MSACRSCYNHWAPTNEDDNQHCHMFWDRPDMAKQGRCTEFVPKKDPSIKPRPTREGKVNLWSEYIGRLNRNHKGKVAGPG